MEHLLFPRGQIYSDTSQEWGGRCAFPIPHLSRPGSAPSSIHQGQPMPPRDQREQAIPPIPPWTRCVFQLAGAPADHLVWPPWNTCFALAHTRPLMPNGPPPPPPPIGSCCNTGMAAELLLWGRRGRWTGLARSASALWPTSRKVSSSGLESRRWVGKGLAVQSGGQIRVASRLGGGAPTRQLGTRPRNL